MYNHTYLILIKYLSFNIFKKLYKLLKNTLYLKTNIFMINKKVQLITSQKYQFKKNKIKNGIK